MSASRDLDSYQPGERVYYAEDGGLDLCYVVSNNCTKGRIRYRLHIVASIWADRGGQRSEPGYEFDFELDRNVIGTAVAAWVGSISPAPQ
jgi:hypothetical protein